MIVVGLNEQHYWTPKHIVFSSKLWIWGFHWIIEKKCHEVGTWLICIAIHFPGERKENLYNNIYCYWHWIIYNVIKDLYHIAVLCCTCINQIQYQTQNVCLCPFCLPLSPTLIFLSWHLLMWTHRHKAYKPHCAVRSLSLFCIVATTVCHSTHTHTHTHTQTQRLALYHYAVHPLTVWTLSTELWVMTKCTLTNSCQHHWTELLIQPSVRECLGERTKNVMCWNGCEG